ncbi:V-set domain-containing T-cell activation inhibitor 1 [Scomber scombrus]|uniref:V-set domain-containing T-cell activation inhibitor 1 n=1 Tax=Scomber scombrus TaxID=13677 RepID=UPI002DDB8683|nr:V-set domain-containing T-cell activation inhibitor 1 [Scomber scombrus]
MASLGQIIFTSMIILIILFSTIIILILAIAFAGKSPLSEAQSSNRSPIANLGEDELLSCYLHTTSEKNTFSQVSVSWEKTSLSGVVYDYYSGVADFTDQNLQFKGRTQFFPETLVQGNASLLLRSVRQSDEGEYTCYVSSAEGDGQVSINLRTAAFTAPKFTVSNGTLTAEANRWFPKPNVTWLDYFGKVLQGSTSFMQNTAGISSIVSTLKPFNISDTYTLRIQNDLVTAVSEATATLEKKESNPSPGVWFQGQLCA